MAIFDIQGPDGAAYEIDAPDQAAALAAFKKMQAGGPTQPMIPGGIAGNAGAGLIEGAVGFGTMGGNLREGLTAGAEWAANKLGAQPEASARVRALANDYGRYLPGLLGGQSKEQVMPAVEAATGPLPTAQTDAERYTRAAAEFVPGALLGPGNVVRKAVQYGVVPGLTSEYAGERAKGTQFETPARLAGALLGVGAGVAGGAAYNAGKNRLAAGLAAGDVSDVVGSPVGAGATRRLADSLAKDRVTPESAAATVAELGDDAMVLDLGRQLRGRAEAVAAQPGRGQNTVLDAVENRTGRFGQGTAQRVSQTLDAEMGPTHNVVELVDRVNETVDRVARPLYRQVMDAHPVLTVPAAVIERPAVAQAMKNAGQLARQHGENISGVTERRTILSGPGYNIGEDVTIPAQPSLRYWDYVKKDLDRRINAYQRSGGASELNSADKADLSGLMDARRALVSHLDDVTDGAYKEARQTAATKYELREAIDFGRSAFNSKLLPEEFRAALDDMSAPERAMAKVGFRRELDRLIETTRNEGATARRILDTNHVLKKTEDLFGARAAQEIERRVGAENTFQEATQDIARNSRTAVRQELVKDTSTPSSSEIRSASMPGLAWAAGRGGLNYLRDHGMERTRDQIGTVLTQGGDQIDPLVRALMGLNARRAANSAPAGDLRAAIANALNTGR